MSMPTPLRRQLSKLLQLTSIRSYATVPSDIISQTNRVEKTLKPFWKSVTVSSIDDSLIINLDKRPLKTPGGKKLVIPSSRKTLAALIGCEWNLQTRILKTHSLPLTSLAARSIDTFDVNLDSTPEIDQLMRYLDTDAMCYHATEPTSLVEMQKQRWEPIITWVQETYNVDIKTTVGFSPAKQTPETHQKLRKVIEGWRNSSSPALGALKLAGFERTVLLTKSFFLSLAFIDGHINVEQAADAARVEVLDQISRWGEVEDTHDVDKADMLRQLGAVSMIFV